MKNMNSVTVLAVFAGISSAALAGGLQINFDEIAASNSNSAVLSNEYAGLGVNFLNTDDGAIFDGITQGDPGSWLIEGTNGSQFMGFNGSSYSTTMLFDTAVSAFSLDASRSNGSSAGDTFTIEGYLNGGLVDSMTVTFGEINIWSTLSLAGDLDEVQMFGNGGSFHPFGVDNINWNGVPTPASFALLSMSGLVAGRRRR
ncbi:MAG: hypothetical protein ACSHX5_00720 [Phycisphaerales bacterium]